MRALLVRNSLPWGDGAARQGPHTRAEHDRVQGTIQYVGQSLGSGGRPGDGHHGDPNPKPGEHAGSMPGQHTAR